MLVEDWCTHGQMETGEAQQTYILLVTIQTAVSSLSGLKSDEDRLNGGVASLAGGRPVLSWVDDGSLSPPPPNVPAAPSLLPVGIL